MPITMDHIAGKLAIDQLTMLLNKVSHKKLESLVDDLLQFAAVMSDNYDDTEPEQV